MVLKYTVMQVYFYSKKDPSSVSHVLDVFILVLDVVCLPLKRFCVSAKIITLLL